MLSMTQYENTQVNWALLKLQVNHTLSPESLVFVGLTAVVDERLGSSLIFGGINNNQTP